MKDDLPTVLTRLDAWLAANVPAIHATLRPGASDAELDDLETLTGLKLPEAFRTLYRWHDGQEWGAGFALGLEFLPLWVLDGVGREWEMWQEIGEAHLEMNTDIPSTSHPPSAIQDAYTTPGWLGFLKDGGGNFVGLDFNPGPAGTLGQVITFGRDEEDKFVLADSLDGFLREYLGRLESGRVTVRRREDFDEEIWGVELHDATGRPAGGGYTLADFYPGFGASPEIPRR
ncbi:SMI1/KNR4 family protein [Deinococcus sp. YIM 134068]|uniref:SMI1/KNR4 family protein n=1 Tax=Deinococcus lichenicola TaxID=3118910 RepID=UPI002F95561F